MTKKIQLILLTILALCEIGCFFLSPLSVSASTIIYTLAGVSICVIALVKTITTDTPSPLAIDRYRGYTYILYVATVLLLVNWVSNTFRAHIYGTPLDIHMGDMLIFIREMSQRYIDHQHVYAPITGIYGMPVDAVYLPAFWLPLTIPMRLGADMRWALLIALACAMLISSYIRFRSFSIRHFLLLLPMALLIFLLLDGAAYYLMFTQEAVVLAYVAVLGIALLYENWILAGIAAALCIMSRYFIGAPLLAGIIWLYITDTRAARRTAIAALMTLIVILTVSHSWGDIGYFFKIPLLYAGLLNDASSFEAFHHIYYHSVGFAALIEVGSLHILTTINLAMLVLAPPAYFMYAYRYLSTRSKGLIILSGIKIFLVLFLTTLSRPFGYVLYTSSLVSILLLKNALTVSPPKEDYA